MKRIAVTLAAVIAVAIGTFVCSAINTLTDDDYWPDLE